MKRTKYIKFFDDWFLTIMIYILIVVTVWNLS